MTWRRGSLMLSVTLITIGHSAGCHVSGPGYGLGERQFRLAADKRTHRDVRGIQFVRVEPDGTVVYRQGPDCLAAAPGGPLLKGTRIVRSDSSSQSAVFSTLWTWEFTTYHLGPFTQTVFR